MGKARQTSCKSEDNSEAGHGEVRLDIPQAFSNGDPYAIWRDGGPGPLLRRLAIEQATGEATLTQEELADLVELFREEPLPESLRRAVTSQLRGKRQRRQGAPKKRQTSNELVDYIALPGAYADALEDAKVERARLKKQGRKQGRHDDADRLPSLSSIACKLVRERLPTFKHLTDRSLKNEVSKAKKLLADADEETA